jgi:hypothetical protein
MCPDPLFESLRLASCDLARSLRVESISSLVAELWIKLARALVLGLARMAATSLQLIGLENILKVPG